MLMTSRLKKYKPPVNTLYEKIFHLGIYPSFTCCGEFFFKKNVSFFSQCWVLHVFLLFMILSFSNIAKIHRNRKSEN